MFLLHGTPGSRIGPLPREGLLYRLGVRLITYDRPGYGDSDRHEGRSVGDVAADVAAIADHFGLDRFAVVGRSGGGPHALACAALIPHRVTRAAVLVGLAPREAEGLDWFDGMSEGNIAEYMTAMQGRARLAARLGPTAAEIREDPVRLVNALYDELPEPDRSVIADAGIRTMLVQNYAEAVRNSAYGWIDDAMAFCSPWGSTPPTSGSPRCCGTARTTCSHRSATPAGWPGGYLPPRCGSSGARRTSTPCTCCPTCSAGSPGTNGRPDRPGRPGHQGSGSSSRSTRRQSSTAAMTGCASPRIRRSWTSSGSRSTRASSVRLTSRRVTARSASQISVVG